jgi:hypothetical protein
VILDNWFDGIRKKPVRFLPPVAEKEGDKLVSIYKSSVSVQNRLLTYLHQGLWPTLVSIQRWKPQPLLRGCK